MDGEAAEKRGKNSTKCAVTDGKVPRFMGYVVIGGCVRWQSHGR